MKNFRKMALGLLVAVLAVGFSAFTSESKDKSLLTYRYANNGAEYIQVPTNASTDDCISNSPEPCLIESDQNLADFPLNDKPSDWQPVQDAQDGTYNP